MDISRFSIVESEVRPLIVVQPDGLLNSSLSMLPIEEKGIEPILDFEDAIDAFGQGILIAVADLAHARADAGGEEPLTIGSRGVLDAVVRMMNHAGQRGCGRLVQGHVKGAKTAFDGERGGQIIANNEAREGIGEEGQIGETGLSREVGDVADPHLVNAMETEFSDQVREFPKPRTGGATLAAFGRRQKIMPLQKVKEGVSTSGNAKQRQLGLQLVQQLTPSHVWMSLTNSLHEFHQQLLLSCLHLSSLQGLIMRLATNPKPAARFYTTAYSRSGDVLDDLGAKVFFRSIPSSSLATASVAVSMRLSNVLCARADSSAAIRPFMA